MESAIEDESIRDSESFSCSRSYNYSTVRDILKVENQETEKESERRNRFKDVRK